MFTKGRIILMVLLGAVSLASLWVYSFAFLAEMERTDRHPADIGEPGLLSFIVWPVFAVAVACGIAAIVLVLHSLIVQPGKRTSHSAA